MTVDGSPTVHRIKEWRQFRHIDNWQSCQNRTFSEKTSFLRSWKNEFSSPIGSPFKCSDLFSKMLISSVRGNKEPKASQSELIKYCGMSVHVIWNSMTDEPVSAFKSSQKWSISDADSDSNPLKKFQDDRFSDDFQFKTEFMNFDQRMLELRVCICKGFVFLLKIIITKDCAHSWMTRSNFMHRWGFESLYRNNSACLYCFFVDLSRVSTHHLSWSHQIGNKNKNRNWSESKPRDKLSQSHLWSCFSLVYQSPHLRNGLGEPIFQGSWKTAEWKKQTIITFNLFCWVYYTFKSSIKPP